MVRRVARRGREQEIDNPFVSSDDGFSLMRMVRQYLALKAQKKVLEARAKDLNLRISGVIEDQGYEDDKGNVYLDLPETIEGVPRLKRERYVIQKPREDQTTAFSMLKDWGLYERCTRQVTVVDEEEIMAAHFEGLVAEEDIDRLLDALYERSVNYRLTTPKGD